jgi:hypothetical protein
VTLEALQSAIGALVLAQALGAPAGALEKGLEALKRATEARPVASARVRSQRPPPTVIRQPVREQTAWDPETHIERIEASRYRALLLEVVKRAIHDWVLYRGHTALDMRELAESAYIWLFEEEPGHAWYKMREREGHTIVSFVVICEICDLDPSYVRERARNTTVKQIMTAGRPAERRCPKREVSYEEHAVETVSIDSLEEPGSGYASEYERHFATATPRYL